MPSPLSYSQHGQDRYVIDTVFGGKRGGFFVEAGAGDGLWISNTLLLEREYGWTGILIEPTSAFERLRQNRAGAICERACLASERKPVVLLEVLDRGQAKMSARAADNLLLSKTFNLDAAVGKVSLAPWSTARGYYKVEAVPLQELLRKHNAPKLIDYFSLDVEGFEEEVLRNFAFDEFGFGCIGIEKPSEFLHRLLVEHGYVLQHRAVQDCFYLPASPPP